MIPFAFQTGHYGDDELGSCLRSKENEGPEVQLQPRQREEKKKKEWGAGHCLERYMMSRI